MNWRTRSRPDLRTRLVAKLGLNLVPDLRKLLVAAQFLAGDIGHDLFVGHAQANSAPLRSFRRNMLSPITAQRPLSSHNSRG